MAEGEGEWSYSKNSRRPVIILTLFLGYNYILRNMHYYSCCICTKFLSNDMLVLVVLTIATIMYIVFYGFETYIKLVFFFKAYRTLVKSMFCLQLLLSL